ncbi:hypothetical protein BGZ81_003560 [Podila clonocystis]|nr:hypothetical protein BGZ81_003560 [Podila clonocystis]
MNCYGTFRTLKLAQGMPLLAAFVHVSTSFVNAHLTGQQINEQIYPYPLGDAEKLFDMFEKMSDDDLLAYERRVALQVFPNTYIVSKSLTEQLIKCWSGSMGLPVVIVRPSMVTAALSEPVPGWVEGMSGFNGVMVLCALGAIQEWIGDENLVMDLVPVDMVCNTILMVATQAKRYLPTVPVFQIGTSSHSPVILNQICRSFEQYWQQVKLSSNNPRVSNDIRAVLYSATDFEFRFKQRFRKELAVVHEGHQRSLSKRLAKAYWTPKNFTTFLTREWFMNASNAIALDEAAPRELYNGLKNGINWGEYLHIYNMGVHEFILKENVDKKKVVDYFWKSIQGKGPQSDDNVKDVVMHISAALSRL